MSADVRLDDASVEAIAHRVAELLREDHDRDPDRLGPALLTVAEVASRLGRSADWVREHRQELGVQTFGNGERPRLMFPREAVEGLARSGRPDSPGSRDPEDRQPRRRPAPAGELLPVRGAK